MVRAQQAHNGCYCEPSSSLLKTLPEQIVLAEFRWTVNAGEEPCEEVDLDGIGDIHALDYDGRDVAACGIGPCEDRVYVVRNSELGNVHTTC